MKEFIDKTSTTSGTPINREAMLAIQGFEAVNTVFNSDGSVVETNSNGETLVTIFHEDGSIEETFSGQKTVTKTTVFNSNGSISEVLS